MSLVTVVGVEPRDDDGRFRLLAEREHRTRREAIWWVDMNADTWRDALEPGETGIWAVVLSPGNRRTMRPVMSLALSRDRAIGIVVHDAWATEQLLQASPIAREFLKEVG